MLIPTAGSRSDSTVFMERLKHLMQLGLDMLEQAQNEIKKSTKKRADLLHEAELEAHAASTMEALVNKPELDAAELFKARQHDGSGSNTSRFLNKFMTKSEEVRLL